MSEAYAIHPNVVAYLCAKRMVSYKDYKDIAENFFNTTKRVVWNEKVYNLVAQSKTKCKIYPVESECKRVLDTEFLALCSSIASNSQVPSVAEGVRNWALSNLDYCIITVPCDTVK